MSKKKPKGYYKVVIGRLVMVPRCSRAEAVNQRAMLRRGGFAARIVRVRS